MGCHDLDLAPNSQIILAALQLLPPFALVCGPHALRPSSMVPVVCAQHTQDSLDLCRTVESMQQKPKAAVPWQQQHELPGTAGSKGTFSSAVTPHRWRHTRHRWARNRRRVAAERGCGRAAPTAPLQVHPASMTGKPHTNHGCGSKLSRRS